MGYVAPTETRPARMKALAVLPVFFDLAGQRAVVAGSGDALVWKAELLAAAGARVTVLTEEPTTELAELAASPPNGSVEIAARAWRETDLDGAVIAVGALAGDEAIAFADAAHLAGVPVNIVDTPDASTFSFGSIVNRSPVVVGISTAGAAPVLGQAIRAKIEALLHPALAAWANAARRLRASLNARTQMGAARRKSWRQFADRALAARSEPRPDELAEIVRSVPARYGQVVLVGAGPGDPELLTLKALRALQAADIILYDRLVSPEILELARREARRMLVGKADNGSSCRQDDISALMVKLAREGRNVVRLKGGDPMIFGRAAEEIEACRTVGISVEVVPGITAALGAAAELGLPLTDRHRSRRVHLATGHAEGGGVPEHDWASLADPWATTVLYMGARTVSATLQQMIAAGLDPETPAVVASAATTPRKKHVFCRARELAEAVSGVDRSEPCLVMIGRALDGAGGRAAESQQACGAAETPSLHRPIATVR